MNGLIASRRFLASLGVLAACLVAGATTSVLLGQDENWDLRNYHLYNGYAALHDRFHTDLAAAGLQSWINPTLDIPYAWLALDPLSAHPVILTALMGIWYGALVAVILGVGWKVYRFLPNKLRWTATAAATVLAATGAALFSQVGTTFNEIQTATLVLGTVWLLLHTSCIATPESRVPMVVAGALLGAAAGLKITSAIYAPAVLIALSAISRRPRVIGNAISLSLGGVAGFLVGGGWWAARLYAVYRSPTFPFFNGIFHSPWYPPVNFFDRRFLPHTVWQTLFYPLFWTSRNRMLVTEIPFRDWRMAVAFVLGLLSVVALASSYTASRASEAGRSDSPLLPREGRFLLLFAAVSYIFWIGTTAILRYAVPLEVSFAISIPLLLWIVLRPETGQKVRTGAWLVVNGLVVAVVLVTTQYPEWGRVPYGSRVVSADMSWVPHGALVVMVGAPIAYTIPFTSPDRQVSFVGLTDVVFESRGWKLADEVTRRIATHHGPIAIIWENNDAWRLPSLPDMGLQTIPGTCHSFYGSFETEKDRGLNWCLARASVHRLNSAFWKLASLRYNEIEVPEPVDGWSYAGFRNAVGKKAARKYYVDNFEYLWSSRLNRPPPAQFDDKIMVDTLYILSSPLKSRAIRAMNRSRDLLATVDGILVLAPNWRATSPK